MSRKINNKKESCRDPETLSEKLLCSEKVPKTLNFKLKNITPFEHLEFILKNITPQKRWEWLTKAWNFWHLLRKNKIYPKRIIEIQNKFRQGGI